MTKKMIRVDTKEYIDIDWTPVDEFAMQCQIYIEQYGDSARFEYMEDYNEQKKLVLTYERMETDEEYDLRIKDELYWLAHREKNDRATYERLKQKFGEDK